jgi:hypothetical protein
LIATAAAIGLGTWLTGCSDIYLDRRDPIAMSGGDAIAANEVTQMVDPWPARSGDKNIAYNGQRMQAAVERYRTNTVIPPLSATTSIFDAPTAAAAPPGAQNAASPSPPSASPTTSASSQ